MYYYTFIPDFLNCLAISCTISIPYKTPFTRMLVMGVCNPAGEQNSYNGLYYTGGELSELVSSGSLLGRPVKAEHTGGSLGRIVSSFVDDRGKLNCVMKLDDSVEGATAW